eukprot:1160185-Pelagomonas_calceolata.AAC.12
MHTHAHLHPLRCVPKLDAVLYRACHLLARQERQRHSRDAPHTGSHPEAPLDPSPVPSQAHTVHHPIPFQASRTHDIATTAVPVHTQTHAVPRAVQWTPPALGGCADAAGHARSTAAIGAGVLQR